MGMNGPLQIPAALFQEEEPQIPIALNVGRGTNLIISVEEKLSPNRNHTLVI
jgi:hypothetical protein